MTSTSLTHLLAEIDKCIVCEPHLDHAPRPVVQASPNARIVIIGQAPGRRVHESGVPWDDPSGRTLRRWLNLTDDQFYDPNIVALIPMGFCYPGSAASGDKPPRPECAPLWHEPLLAELPANRLDIIIGIYAQKRYIKNRKKTLTDTVANWEEYLPNQGRPPPPLTPKPTLAHQKPLVRNENDPRHATPRRRSSRSTSLGLGVHSACARQIRWGNVVTLRLPSQMRSCKASSDSSTGCSIVGFPIGEIIMKGYVAKKGKQCYDVIYEGLDPVTGKEKRTCHTAGPNKAAAEKVARSLAEEVEGRNDKTRSLTFGAYLMSQWLPGKANALAESTWHG